MFTGTADIYEPAYGHCGTRDDADVSADGRARVVRTAEEEALAAGLDGEAREEGEEDTADTDEDARIGRSCYLGDAHSSGRVLDLPQARGHGAVEATVVLGKSHQTRDDEDYYYLKGDVRKFRGRFLNGFASAPSASTSEVSSFHLRMGIRMTSCVVNRARHWTR